MIVKTIHDKSSPSVVKAAVLALAQIGPNERKTESLDGGGLGGVELEEIGSAKSEYAVD